MDKEINAVLAIAFRDFSKFTHDRVRILATFTFPVLFIGVLGSSLQSNLSSQVGFSFLTFTFTGVLAQTLFQSTASGIISLIQDRESDFSQEMFVSPVSRFSIIIGKIIGESMVAFAQAVGIIGFGLILGVPIGLSQLLAILPVAVIVCLLGGAFGLLVLANLKDQRSANQIFPFLIFPQFFLAGVFNPIKELPGYLLVLSRLSPMTYAVDLLRSIFYIGKPEYSRVVLFNPTINLLVISLMLLIFIIAGTYFFVHNERNR